MSERRRRNVVVSVRLTDEELRQIRHDARRKGETVATFMREAVQAGLPKLPCEACPQPITDREYRTISGPALVVAGRMQSERRFMHESCFAALSAPPTREEQT